ncbi:hypothetical protein WMY93_019500 [Mugilogobius chulae]|uniref:Ciliogenesis and planar polarity effector 1 n=1 Tax=Mugilogobius chulae TaxID=88201 RepID=A0AAW0NP78_9GOBI
MELKLEVVLSSSIKRKKPWPRFCWLGQEKESVFLLDDKRISEINMVSGRTKKRTPKLHPLLNNVVTMGSSSNGMWLCGLLKTGKIFMWNRDKDLLKTTTTLPEVAHFTSCIQGSASRLSVNVSGDGRRVLLVAVTGQIFLGSALSDVCLSAFVFTSGNKLIISCLKINWGENQEKIGPIGYSVKWATKTLQMSGLKPPCQPVKSRGALVSALSPDGQLLAIVLNQRQPQATQVLFVSTVNFVSVSRSLGGCGSKKMAIPSKYIRSYWVGCVSWSAGGLFLACVLKRGSLLMLARLGGLLTLSTTGCNVDFGPAHFLPLHPLVTYRPPSTVGKGEASLSSSSLSVRDVMRQRYSVTWHSQLFYFIVSDGYMATVVRVLDKISPARLLMNLLKDTTKDLEEASQTLEKLQNHVKLWLDSVSPLNMEKNLLEFGSTYRPKTTDVITSADGSTLPFFLQDHGTMGGPREILETVQTIFDNDSDVDGVPAGSHVEEGGRLEFASMFDTLHALNTHYEQVLDSDSEQGSTVRKKITSYDLEKIESKLLTAWACGVSMGRFLESKTFLFKHAIKCAVRFAALLQLIPNSMTHPENYALNMLDFLKKLLHFTSWEKPNSEGPQFVGIIVELCRNLVQLVLTPYTESYQSSSCEISSQDHSTALQILQMFSRTLDQTCTLQQRGVWSSVENESSQPLQLWPSDLHNVPLMEAQTEEETDIIHCALPGVQPSRRLHDVWRWMYTVTQKYMEELEHFKGCDNWEGEKQQLVIIMCKIQAALQASGEPLEERNTLLNYTGMLKINLNMFYFRHYFCLFFAGEHLFLSGFYTESSEVWYSQLLDTCKESGKSTVFQEKRLSLALLYSLLSQYQLKKAQELGDHMASLILQTNTAKQHQDDGKGDCIDTKEDSLQCLWFSNDLSTDAAYAVVQSLGRFMASYFSNQTLYVLPPHNVDILPPIHITHASSVGRLVPLCQEEVAKAVRQQQLSEIWTVEYAQDLLLLGGLLPESVWLAYHLGDWKAAASLSQAYSSYCKHHFDFTAFNKRELHLPKDLEPEKILQAELNCLLGGTKEQKEANANQSFSDPINEEDLGLLHISIQDILKASVMAGVDAVSSPLSSLLDKAKDLCSCLSALVPTPLYLPSPPLYCPQPSPNTQDPAGTPGFHAEVVSRHKISEALQKLLLLLRSANCCYPAAQWYISQLRRTRHILYKMKKKYSYPCASQEEKSFPEGLLKFINRSGHFKRRPKKNFDAGTVQTIICFRELCGLCWMLHVRDQLSLSCRKYQADRQRAQDDQDSETRAPCVDALQWAQRFLPFSRFLNCEETVQDTILSLLSELPPVANTLALSFPDEVESVRVPLREKYNNIMQNLRQRNVIETLWRLRRHLAPLELHLWEKEMEDEDVRSKHEVVTPRQHLWGQNAMGSSGDAKEKDNPHSAVKAPPLPSVGSWEFELEDEEYLNFLELFLSYLLEKDSADTSNDLPLLKDFSHKLREKELHSLAFDVLTTMHRRQRDGHQARKTSEPRIFRAGSCFRPVSEDPALISAVTSQASFFQNQNSSTCFPQRAAGSHKGLFSHQNQLRKSPQSSIMSALSLRFCSVAPAVELLQGLNSDLEAQFPELGRLLEWMMRWADRRLCWATWQEERCRRRDFCARSAHSLCLTECRYKALLRTDLYKTHIKVPNTQWVVAPVQVTSSERKGKKQSRADSTHSELATTPTTALDLQITTSSVGSCAGEPVEETVHSTHLVQDQLYPDNVSRASSSQSPEAVIVTLQEEDRCSSVSSEACTPGTSLKLEDLDNSQNLSSSASILPKTSHAEPQIRSTDKEEASPAAPPSQPCATDQASEVQNPQMRQRLGEDLYRLVQNINYMSLMEVLGASFSNLQLAQQNASLAQSNLSFHSNVPWLNVQHAMPPQNAQAVPSPLMPYSQPNLPTNPTYMHNQPNTTGIQHNVNMNLQTPPPPSTFTQQPLTGGQEIAPLSVQAGSPVRNVRKNLIPCSEHSERPCSSSLGLKLLQLRPPQIPGHGSRQDLQSPQNYPHHESSSSMFKYNDQTKARFILQLNSSLSLPHISHAAPMGETPRIKLLQIEPQPKMMLPLQASLSQVARLIPEKLRSVLGKKQSDRAQVQLLRAVKPAEDSSDSAISLNSTKRQKRREKLETLTKKEISFRPNDSIIPQETAYDPPTKDLKAFAQRGEFTGESFATAAELHAFASTSKKPPECHDACTNTDSDISLVDKAVFADIRTKNLQHLTDQDQLQPAEDRYFTPHGRQFVSVVDLEDKTLHQDLPLYDSAEATAAELHVMATRVLEMVLILKSPMNKQKK